MPFLFGDVITKPLVGLVKFGTFATLNTILTIETFMTFMTFVQSDEVTLPDQKKLCDVVTFETLITVQTIENLNS